MSAERFSQSGKWSTAGVPHKGWTCIDIEDLGEPLAICEMCETQKIRFVHHMTHPAYADELHVGCVCAGRMEEDYEAAKARETVMRNASSRKRRWLTRKWQTSQKGNTYLNADGYNVVVFKTPGKGGAWGFRVTNRATDDNIQSRKPYATEDAAKLRAFDAIVWMKQRGR